MFDYFRALKISEGTSKEKMKQHEGRLSRQAGLDREEGGKQREEEVREEEVREEEGKGGRREGSDRDED